MKPKLKIMKLGWEYRWVCVDGDSVTVIGPVAHLTLNDIFTAAGGE